MADTDTWMPLYIGDYLGDTRHLSTLEHGAYLLLLMYAWTHEGQLPGNLDRLRRITGVTPKEWKNSWPTLEEFFATSEEGFRHGRIDREIARQQDKITKRRAAANTRWAKQTDSKSNANASGLHKQKPMNAYENQNQNQNQKEERENNTPPLNAAREPTPHGSLAFSGGIVRVNHREFAEWGKVYHGIPDLRATLTSLDVWIEEAAAADHTVPQRWRRMVTSMLDKKHQEWLAEVRRGEADEHTLNGPC